MNTIVFKVVLARFFLALWTLAGGLAQAADVCRNPSFAGMWEHKKRAERVLPASKTSSIGDAVFYVEYDPRLKELYYHSNFVTPGYENSTKVRGDPNENAAFGDATTMFLNMVYDEPPSPSQKSAAVQALHKNVKVLVDVSALDENGVPRLDLTGISNIVVVDGKQSQTLASAVEVLPTAKPPPSVISKIKGCCLYGRPPHWGRRFSEQLSKKSFDADDVKFVSLFVDSATDSAIRSSDAVSRARVSLDTKSLNSEDSLRTVFAGSRGKTVVLLGHVEGTDFVIRRSDNSQQLRVPIATVRQMAREADVRLIDIGCETTKAIQDASFGFGVMTQYRSVEAVQSLNRALATSRTMEDFLVNLSSEGLKIVLEPSFVREPVKSASIYAKAKSTAKAAWVKVAQVTFSHFK